MVRDRLRSELLPALAGDVAIENFRSCLDRRERHALVERTQDVAAERVRVVEDRRAPATPRREVLVEVLVEELVDQRRERLVGRLAPARALDAIEALAELPFGSLTVPALRFAAETLTHLAAVDVAELHAPRDAAGAFVAENARAARHRHPRTTD
jgi:hypothetical protein